MQEIRYTKSVDIDVYKHKGIAGFPAERMSMLEKNTKQVNCMMTRLFMAGAGAVLVLVLLSHLGVFEFGRRYTEVIFVAGLITAISPHILIHFVSDNVMRYLMMISVSLFIGVLGTSNHIGVYITYALVPIFSCLYFDPGFTVKMSILSYLIMVVSVYINSAGKFEVVYLGRPRLQMAIAYILGFTIEFVVVCGILYFLVKRARQMMEERYSAEAQNRMKSEFLSSVSHEIRTPMNAIIGMADVALRKDMDEELRHYLTIIKSSSTGLLEIVNDILDLSKVEAGKFAILETVYSTETLADDIKVIVDARNIDKKIPIRYHVQENMPPYLCGDAVRIRQVVLNFASNAIKYTDSGSIDITIGCTSPSDNKEKNSWEKDKSVMLTCSVADTGQGIREEDIGQLFTMYGQLDRRKNYGKEGTGIGLALCKHFIEQMGGRIRVESQYGKGSVFSFELPQKLVTDEETIAKMESQNKSGQFGQNGVADLRSFTITDGKILLVDDNDINREVVKAMLEPLSLEIDEAGDGGQAVELAKKTKYDLILMDSHMPVMSGEEATREIRKLSGYGYESGSQGISNGGIQEQSSKNQGLENQSRMKRVPIIALTADAIAGVRERLLSCGMDDYIVKPVDEDVLFQMLREYLPKEKIQQTTQK